MVIKKFEDGSILEYNEGKFDKWCVYLITSDNNKTAPRDDEYFIDFYNLSLKYGNQKIYNDFINIYDKTTSSIDGEVLSLITKISSKYPDNLFIERLFTIVYAGMVAEENKQNAILKKRIKRLGMHQVIMEQISPIIAANFSRGKKWSELDKECKSRGF